MNPNTSLLERAGLDTARVGKLIERGIEGADDGELFLEYKQSEMLVFDNGRLKQATYDTNQGFGLRAVKDEAVGYAHASEVSEAAIARAADAVRAVKGGHSGRYAEAPGRSNVKLYSDDNPLAEPGFDAKVRLLETIDAYARGKDARVQQVTASLGASWQVVEIVRPDGHIYRDIRPLVRINVSVVAASGDRQRIVRGTRMPCSASTRRAKATCSGNFSRNWRRTSERVLAASASLAGNSRSTPNGLFVRVRTLRITLRISSGVRPEPPMQPMPPASEIAATSSAGVALPREPMPARRIGYSIPKISHSAVFNRGRGMIIKN